MGSWLNKAAVTVSFLAVAAVAAPAAASQDIAWTWNSGDHDAKANFASYGEVYHAVGYEPDTYVDWTGPGVSGRWNLKNDSTQHSLNFDWVEGKSVSLNVCQQHNLFPDDCSGKKYGVS